PLVQGYVSQKKAIAGSNTPILLDIGLTLSSPPYVTSVIPLFRPTCLFIRALLRHVVGYLFKI
ncbi:MAG: hypothetical protein ACK53Y_13700, partial [bacterium]